jgi:hypothetical protein
LGAYNLSINIGVSLVKLIKSYLLEETTGTEKTSCVGGSVVLKTYRKSVTWKLVTVSLYEDTVTIDESVGNLTDYLSVGETYYKTVLWGLVLVLVLGAESFTLTVVGTTLTSTTKFDLVTAEVSLALLNFDEWLNYKRRRPKN